MNNKNMITYYVSYAHKSGFGAVTLNTNLPIRESDITIMREKIHEANPQFKTEDIIILNFIKLER